MTMFPSVLLPSFNADFGDGLRAAVELGFHHVDIVASAARPEAEREALAESGLVVACAAVGRGLADGQALDAADVELRRAALETMKHHLDDAALFGATVAYIVPGLDATPAALARFTDTCRLLADHAAARKVRLCVEHVPRRALPEARNVVDWLGKTGHPNLFLLLDVGHCLISREDPAAIVRQAGTRLGWVHVDDNDGIRDLHLPLLAGRLTELDLRAVLDALGSVQYRGGVCLELCPDSAAPRTAVAAGKVMLERLLA